MHRRFLISRFFIVCIGFVLSEIQIVAAESFPQVRFTPLPSDILPSNEVRKLYQDSDGYIWIPTYNGLARYDGYGAITYGMELMLAMLSIIQGVISTIMNAAGFGTPQQTVLPTEIVTAIEDCGFFESIPLWAVTLIGSLFIWVLSFIMILSVYGRFFKNRYCTDTAVNLCRGTDAECRKKLP